MLVEEFENITLNEMKEAIIKWLENADFKPKPKPKTDELIVFEKINT